MLGESLRLYCKGLTPSAADPNRSFHYMKQPRWNFFFVLTNCMVWKFGDKRQHAVENAQNLANSVRLHAGFANLIYTYIVLISGICLNPFLSFLKVWPWNLWNLDQICNEHLPTRRQNWTTGAPGEAKIGPRGYPPEIPRNRSRKRHATGRKIHATGSKMEAEI